MYRLSKSLSTKPEVSEDREDKKRLYTNLSSLFGMALPEEPFTFNHIYNCAMF